MAGKFETPRTPNQPPRRPRRRRRRRIQIVLLLPLVLLMIVAVLLVRCGKAKEAPSETQDTAATEALPTAPAVVSTATVAAQGDLLMHKYLFTEDPKYPSACNLGNGVYNFDSIFKYITPYISAADYAVVNLETTLGGDDFPYAGNPLFNCPDALADAAVNAGFDMLLTANNHCADTTEVGIKHTLEQIRSRNLVALGTQLSGEKRYAVVDVNGIRIGMLCYTYAAGLESDGSPNLNFKSQTIVKEPGLVNYFTQSNLDRLYSEVETILADMKADGAEATMLFIHWGTEYTLSDSGYTFAEDATQRAIAQKMCDMGIDVIVGGHPHVVEPMDLLTSTVDPDHKTVCIYSLGNAVSNQRREEMRLDTGHTEDGAMFTVTFEKDSQGNVYAADCDVLPTWVNKFVNGDGKVEYNILPLDISRQDQWQAQFGMTDALQASYSRTMNIVGAGLTKCQEYLRQKTAPAELAA